MTSHEFTLKLNRSVTPEDAEALYEAGCSDAAIETGPLGAILDFNREAPELAEALISAIHDIEKVPGLTAVGVVCDNLMSLADIAELAGVTREAARLWSVGRRGPGGFPAPVLITRGGEKGWHRAEVEQWIASHRERTRIPTSAELERPGNLTFPSRRWSVLYMADRVLEARQALRLEPDETVRGEFERLLEDA